MLISNKEAFYELANEPGTFEEYVYIYTDDLQVGAMNKYQIRNLYYYNKNTGTYFKICWDGSGSYFSEENWEIDYKVTNLVKEGKFDELQELITVPMSHVIRVMVNRKMLVSNYSKPIDIIDITTSVVLEILEKIKKSHK